MRILIAVFFQPLFGPSGVFASLPLALLLGLVVDGKHGDAGVLSGNGQQANR